MRRWHDETHASRNPRESYVRPSYGVGASERSAAHAPPHAFGMSPYYPGPTLARRSSEADAAHRSTSRDIPDTSDTRVRHTGTGGPSTGGEGRPIAGEGSGVLGRGTGVGGRGLLSTSSPSRQPSLTPHPNEPDVGGKRKRHSIDPEEGTRHLSSSPSRTAHMDTTRPSPFKAKSNKRIRINWSDAENQVFFDTIQAFSNADESTVLKEIVAALNGSRNWVQCKGHFRNLQYVGRISQTDTDPRCWIINDQAKSIRSGGGQASSSRDSPSVAGKNDDSPNNDVPEQQKEKQESQPQQSQSHRQAQQSHHHQQSSQGKHGHNGALQPVTVDFDKRKATATEVKSAVTNIKDKPNLERDQTINHGDDGGDGDDDDEDNEENDEQDEDYELAKDAKKESDERVGYENDNENSNITNDHSSNGHSPRKGGKVLRGMMTTTNSNNNETMIHHLSSTPQHRRIHRYRQQSHRHSNSHPRNGDDSLDEERISGVTPSSSRIDVVPDPAAVGNQEGSHVNHKPPPHVVHQSTHEHRREIAMPLKKQQMNSSIIPANSNVFQPLLRSRDSHEKRR